jgi:tetratricopeptide (TPR) repeat protein
MPFILSKMTIWATRQNDFHLISMIQFHLGLIALLLTLANVTCSAQSIHQDQGGSTRDSNSSTEWIATQKRTLDTMEQEKQSPYLISLEATIDELFRAQQSEKDKALSWLAIALYTRQSDDTSLRILARLTNANTSDLIRANSLRLLGQKRLLEQSRPREALLHYEQMARIVRDTTNEMLLQRKPDFLADAYLKSAAAYEQISDKQKAIQQRTRFLSEVTNANLQLFPRDYAVLENARGYLELNQQDLAQQNYHALLTTLLSKGVYTNRTVSIMLECIINSYSATNKSRLEELEKLWTNQFCVLIEENFAVAQNIANFKERAKSVDYFDHLRSILARYDLMRQQSPTIASSGAIILPVYKDAILRCVDHADTHHDLSGMKEMLSRAQRDFQNDANLSQFIDKKLNYLLSVESSKATAQVSPGRRWAVLGCLGVAILIFSLLLFLNVRERNVNH